MSQGKVLIADDSPTVRNILSSILKTEGYDTFLASDGIEAIRSVYREHPDIILLDILMPSLSGYQVCRLLKDDKRVSSIPVIILTSAEGKTEKFWSFETGADEFMVKDFNTPAAVIATVEKFVSRYRKVKQDRSASGVTLSDPVEILSKVSTLLDKQLYRATLEKLKLETILSSLAEGLVAVDAERIITSFNSVMEKMIGVSASDALGKKCCDVFSGSLCKGTCYFYDTFISGKDVNEAEFELTPKSKKTYSVLSSISLLRDDEARLVGAVCVFTDISKIKAVEQMRADFVSMVTHELRSPLTIIKASVNNILQGLTGKINLKQKECLEIARNTSERLLRLVSDLLDLSKIESEQYELNIEHIDIAQVIKHCLVDFELLIKQKQLKVTSLIDRSLPKVAADFNKMEQVFINLISNAIKFTSDKGKIIIQAQDKGDSVECSVADTGRGILPEAQERIFDKFQQIYDRESRKTGGTGLGLSVVKAIIQAHRGKIRVESEVGKGSKFIFSIPKKASG